jgi:hypothetical protein
MAMQLARFDSENRFSRSGIYPSETQDFENIVFKRA